MSEASDWSDTASAPRDGTPILVSFRFRDDGSDAGVHSVRWHEPWGTWVLSAVLIRLDKTGDPSDDTEAVLWTALPSPPTTG